VHVKKDERELTYTSVTRTSAGMSDYRRGPDDFFRHARDAVMQRSEQWGILNMDIWRSWEEERDNGGWGGGGGGGRGGGGVLGGGGATVNMRVLSSNNLLLTSSYLELGFHFCPFSTCSSGFDFRMRPKAIESAYSASNIVR